MIWLSSKRTKIPHKITFFLTQRSFSGCCVTFCNPCQTYKDAEALGKVIQMSLRVFLNIFDVCKIPVIINNLLITYFPPVWYPVRADELRAGEPWLHIEYCMLDIACWILHNAYCILHIAHWILHIACYICILNIAYWLFNIANHILNAGEHGLPSLYPSLLAEAGSQDKVQKNDLNQRILKWKCNINSVWSLFIWIAKGTILTWKLQKVQYWRNGWRGYGMVLLLYSLRSGLFFSLLLMEWFWWLDVQCLYPISFILYWVDNWWDNSDDCFFSACILFPLSLSGVIIDKITDDCLFSVFILYPWWGWYVMG